MHAQLRNNGVFEEKMRLLLPPSKFKTNFHCQF